MLEEAAAMIPIISGDEPQGPNTPEQANKHNMTIHPHMPVPRPPPPIKTNADSVALSHRSKYLLLKAQGRSLHEIAIIMNMDTETVTSYFG